MFLYAGTMKRTLNPSGSYTAPDAARLPDMTPVGENGDPNWDENRFSTQALFPVYNVLLLIRHDKVSERIGVGKMHFEAFHLASAAWETIHLR